MKTLKQLIIATIIAMFIVSSYAQTNTENVNRISTGPDFTKSAELSVHAVVHIKTEFERKSNVYDDFFGFSDPFNFFNFQNQNRTYPISASGSGVIVDSKGYIVTNNHVVQDADVITVTLNDKREFSAVIVGTDPSTDLAVIKIEGVDFPTLSYANSDDVRIGEWVLAVGNPFNLTSTVTAGIVSAKARNLNILGSSSSVESFIQTDAAVNPGNSGGALVNINGDLIGINAAIASNTGSYTGYSFAIPSNIVKKVVSDLKEFGEVQRAFLGASFNEINNKLAIDLNLKDIKGIYVNSVDPNGAASESGIIQGDVILSINNTKINSYSSLKEFLAQHRPGESVNILVLRNNAEKNIAVVLKNKNGTTQILKKEETNAMQMLGATFSEITPKIKQKLRINNGVSVDKIEQGILRGAGIQEGFIITAIDHKLVLKIEDIEKYLKNKKGSILIEGYYLNGMKVIYGIGI